MPNYPFQGGGPFYPNRGYGFNGFGGDYNGLGSHYHFDPNLASPGFSTNNPNLGNNNNNNHIPVSSAEDLAKEEHGNKEGLLADNGFKVPEKKHAVATNPNKTKDQNKFSLLSDEGETGQGGKVMNEETAKGERKAGS
jgi:hypothetical protein